MNRTLRITTFLVALVVLAIAAPLAQAARDGHQPSNDDSGAASLPNFNIYGAETAVTDSGQATRDGHLPAAGPYANVYPNFNIYGAETATLGTEASGGPDGFQPQLQVSNGLTTHPDNAVRISSDDLVGSQARGSQSSTEINWSDVGFGFGAGLLLAVLIGGAVVMSGRARRGGLAAS